MAAGDLTDLDTVKAWIASTGSVGAGGMGTTADTLLGALITSASTFIGNYLSRQLLSATYTEIYQGNGQDFMMLRQAPVTAVSSVQWASTTIPAGTAVPLSPGYYIDANARTLRLISYRFPWRLPVQVSYTAGYADAPVDVQQVCNELVGEAFKRRERIGQTSKTLGGQETTAFSTKDMNDTIKAMLAPYRFLSPLV